MMSVALLKMWFSLGAIAAMFLSVVLILFSRAKLTGIIRFITAFIAYALVIVAGIIMVFVVFSGPVPE